MKSIPTSPMSEFLPGRQRGSALAVCVHVVLLLLVLGQIVYLASRFRLRVDLTSDRLSTVTESTRTVVDKLDKRLVIEAYFSPKDQLPVVLRQTRDVLDNFLDELVQIGKGKVVVQRFDPNEDKAISDRCTRLGIKPRDLRSQSSTSLSVDRHWQGLRLVYGGSKQKVLAQIEPQHWFVAETQLTPAIKEVATERKRKIGYMEWPANGGQQAPSGIGWSALRQVEQIAKRFEFQNYKDEDGALLPEDLETLFLYRPKDLTDRQKYVLDQFLMRGGTLVVFADAAEYTIAPNRQFTNIPLQLDTPASERKFVDQLASYGIDWKPKVLADMAAQAHTPRDRFRAPFEYLALPQMTQFGQQMRPIGYPYFFHAVARDWKEVADQLAQRDGVLDASLAASYREQFVPGIATDDLLFKVFEQLGRGPGFYWPTWVGLREKAAGVPDLPAGVTGRVLMWSSPAVLVEDPPHALDPLGRGDARAQNTNLQKFNQRLIERLQSEARRQAPLMVDVRGTFASFFAGADRPKRPSEIEEEQARKAEAERKANAAAEAQGEGEAPPADEFGPPAPKDDAADDAAIAKAAPEADALAAGTAPGRIVMIGDSDFLRDDLVRGQYQQLGGPFSPFGGAFFLQLLDWLAEDRDLLELQARVPIDRTLQFVDPETVPTGDPRVAEQTLRRKTNWLRAINVIAPVGLLALFGLCVLLVRRAQKRSFHASHP